MRERQDIRRAVGEDESRSDQKLRFIFESGIFQLLVGPHDTGQRVVIGDADGAKAHQGGLMHIFLRVRTAAQEREVRRYPDFRVSWWSGFDIRTAPGRKFVSECQIPNSTRNLYLPVVLLI